MKTKQIFWVKVLGLTLVCASIYSITSASIWESGKIVYTSQSSIITDLDIYSMGPNGDDKTLLTFAATDDYDPTWAPSGRQILFVSEQEGQPDIYIMDSDGGNQRRVRSSPSHRTSPTWAPDGQRFAYSWNLEEIWIYDFVTVSPEYVVDGANPAWSPDGRYIAFIRGGSGSNGWDNASLYVIDLETGTESKLVDATPFSELSDPTWSPQSDYIVFSWLNFFTGGIYYVARWGGEAKIMSQSEGHHLHHPEIAPYGGEMLMEVHPDDYTMQHIYKVTRRTNNWQRLTSGSGYNFDPDWWHPTSFPVQPQTSLSTTTWGELKRK